MSDHLRTQSLHGSDVVAIRDVCCRPVGADPRCDECSDETTIVFPRAGAFLRHVERQSVLGDPHVVMFFHRGEVYRVTHPVAGGDDCTVLAFAPEVLRTALTEARLGMDHPLPTFGVSSIPCGEDVLVATQRLRQALRRQRTWGVQADECALLILGLIVEDVRSRRGRPTLVRRAATMRAHRDTVMAVRQYLDRTFREPLALGAIARHVHCSPYHLARMFSAQTGTPIHRYLTGLRLRAAVERMAQGAEDLTQLALDLGFSSHSHFTTAFTRSFRLSPSDLRRDFHGGVIRQISKNLKA